MLLEVKNLKVRVEDKEILKGINLTVKPGEVHAIMGPNGSGKSTLASTLLASPEYEVTSGRIFFQGDDITDWLDERRPGLHGAPSVDIPGVNNAYPEGGAQCEAQERARQPDAMDFIKLWKEKPALHVDDSVAAVGERGVFGRRGNATIFHMAVLEPTLAAR
jgi:Fe-S cluster assembly ATP-binding protein